MIVFFKKTNGQIVGSIQGRVHNEAQFKMWIGSKEDNDRVILEWKPIEKRIVDKKEYTFWDIEHPQKDLILAIDRREKNLMDYKIDIETKQLVQIT